MQLEGSPLDASVFTALIALAIVVLIRRGDRTRTLLFANRAILIYLVYCLISVVWSYYPGVSLKRWIKATGDLAMVLIIATDQHPVVAIRRTVSRVGFVLLPISFLYIKYFPHLGRVYDVDGNLMNTGVHTNKNSLGLTVLVVSLVVVWNLRSLLMNKDAPDRGRRLAAQGTLLAFGLVLFWMADCSTCKACFVLGTFLMLVSGLGAIRSRPGRVHALCFSILLVAGITILLGGSGGVIAALGRDSTMSGRTELWAALAQAVPNPIIGAGFESFWLSPSVHAFRQQLLDWGWFPPLVRVLNEAHNGYIETYLNLGWIGVALIAAIFAAGYRSSLKVFHKDPELGGFILAFIAVAAAYSITEAGFRIMQLAWVFLLLVVITASGVNTGLVVENGNKSEAPRRAGLRRATAVQRNVRSVLRKGRNHVDPNRRTRS